MATTYKTSEWEFETIDRGSEYISGAIYQKRNNWVISRFRYSNAPFESQEGQTSYHLRGYNAGKLIDLEGPEVYGVKFDTTTEWVRSDTLWVRNGNFASSYPVYVPFLTDSIPDPSLISVLFRSSVYWYVSQYSAEQVQDNDLAVGGGSNFIRTDPADSSEWPLGAIAHTVGANDWAAYGSSKAVPGYYTVPFFCEYDQVAYEDQGVDWYRQTQQWVYRDSWTG